jgi:predicted PurR-regulated permease PerM
MGKGADAGEEPTRSLNQPPREHVPVGRRRVTIAIDPRTLWLVAAIALGIFVLLFIFVHALNVFIVLFIGIIFAEGLRPLVDYLELSRVPRPVGVLLIYTALFVVLALLSYALVQPLINQFTAFVDALPAYVNEAQRLLMQIQQVAKGNAQIQQAVSLLEAQIGTLLSNLLPLLLQVPLTIASLLFDFLLTLLIAFLWLTSMGRLRPFVLGIMPANARPVVESMIDESSQKLGGYLRGVLVNMFVIGILSGLGLWILGVPYPVLLGLLAGLTEFIPFLGPWISGSVAVIVALAAVSPLKAAEVAVFFVVLQQIEGNTLVPFVLHRAVEINPLLVVVAVLIGGAIFGIAGSVLAVPLAALIQIAVMSVLAPAARHASARGEVPTSLDEHAGRPPPAPRTPRTPRIPAPS